MATSPQTGLFKLPVEIRLKIYEYTFTDIKIQIKYDRLKAAINLPATLATCRQLRRELLKPCLKYLKDYAAGCEEEARELDRREISILRDDTLSQLALLAEIVNKNSELEIMAVHIRCLVDEMEVREDIAEITEAIEASIRNGVDVRSVLQGCELFK